MSLSSTSEQNAKEDKTRPLLNMTQYAADDRLRCESEALESMAS